MKAVVARMWGEPALLEYTEVFPPARPTSDRKSTRLNSSHLVISYAVFCLKKKTRQHVHLEERQGDATHERACMLRLVHQCPGRPHEFYIAVRCVAIEERQFVDIPVSPARF